jgi:nucleoid DNA-binding protein
MSRATLVEVVRNAAPGVTLLEAADILNAVLASITDSVHAGESVVLANFGSFSKKVTSARKCRNPATGASVDVPSKTTIRFKPSKSVVVV